MYFGSDRAWPITPVPPLQEGESGITAMRTLDPHIAKYLSSRVKQNRMTTKTSRDVRHTLAGFSEVHGRRPLDQLSKRTVERWLESIRDCRPSTRRNYLSRVRRFCQWLLDRGLIRRDPCYDLEKISQPRRVDRTLEPDEIVAVLRLNLTPRDRAIMWVLAGCGLRCIEVARLTVGDYDRRGRTLLVTGKGGHERRIPVPKGVCSALDYYLSERATAGPMFRSENTPSQGIRATTVSKYVQLWMYQAGIKTRPYDGKSAHAFRHTYCHDLLDVEDDWRVVQELMGHANAATTGIYAGRAKMGKMRAAVDARQAELEKSKTSAA